jgi:hypothetical protein
MKLKSNHEFDMFHFLVWRFSCTSFAKELWALLKQPHASVLFRAVVAEAMMPALVAMNGHVEVSHVHVHLLFVEFV